MDHKKVAAKIVDGILKDMTDRRGLRQEWDGIDPGTRSEIRREWRRIVMLVLAETETGS